MAVGRTCPLLSTTAPLLLSRSLLHSFVACLVLGHKVEGCREWGSALVCYKKIPQIGWPKQDKFIFSQFWNSGGWKSKIKVSVGLFSPEVSLLGLQMVTFSPCPCTIVP